MLSEHEIQRFSRQILVKEISGKGQEKLLRSTIQASGQSGALDVAIAALRAGGSPVERSAQTSAPAALRWETWVLTIFNDRVLLAEQDACNACRDQLLSRDALASPVLELLLGNAAALMMQRAVLGLASSLECLTAQPELTKVQVECSHRTSSTK